jgi:hypothetical protein
MVGLTMRIHFIEDNSIRETHDVDLDLDPANFLQSLDDAIADLQANGHLADFYRRASVTFPTERDDDHPDDDDARRLDQTMEIGIWGRWLPPHLVARRARGRVFRHLGKDRYKPY